MAPPPATPGTTAGYDAETRALCRQGAETACLLAILLVPLFALLDYVLWRQCFSIFLAMRLGCVAVMALIFVTLRSRFGEAHAVSLGVLVAGVVGLMIDVMTIFTGGAASPYYAGVNLVMVAVALLMPWPPLVALFTCTVLVGCYVVCTLATQPIAELRPFASNLFFLITTGTITVVSTLVREHLRRREFSHRTALVEALRHKSDFMARMSHELRTPIHVMIGYADILLEDALETGGWHARELVQHIRGHGALLHRLISDLLDYAKTEAGKMEVTNQPLRLAEVVERVAESFRPLMDRKGLGLVVECDPGLPTLATDRDKVECILRNLIANAVKFTEHGAVRVEARLDDADCLAGFTFIDDAGEGSQAPGTRRVLVFVRDSGIGIRQGDLAGLAADFQQVDPEAAARYGGTGLGLSISKKLVHLLGGRIAVRSRHREGSEFVLCLPLRRPPVARAVPAGQPRVRVPSAA